ncbi:MAG: aminodeoxychorismate synthase, component I [Chlorobiaceae bacterium]|nr:aminodeoxychorismate synthase, component I [Chlorobiaceae bacterium]MBA4308707.1 aminodeoxychorismate synthase, component I [Chlorobiaceae bacterium]
MKIETILNFVLEKKHSAFFYTPSFYPKSYSYFFKQVKFVENIKLIDSNAVTIDLNELWRGIDSNSKKYFGYGIVPYEFGFLLEKKLSTLLSNEQRSAITENFIFAFFDKNNFSQINSNKIDFGDFAPAAKLVNEIELEIPFSDYSTNIKKIKNYISAGDTYQINYTLKNKFSLANEITTLFKKLIFNQSSKYSAIINLGERLIISISPELFFNLEENKITIKPMKGTIRRGCNIDEDKKKNEALKTSEKNLAENLMIVDLIRNDLGKICEFNSVRTKKLFEVEKYESIYQMVSTIDGRLKKDLKLSDVLKNIFPCGSITGAPKIRTMEIISEIEKSERGIYTGAIGIITPKKSVFSVAIRTLEIDKKTSTGKIGLGSGIVWDSVARDEFNEVKLKANFLTQANNYFDLFESMLIERNEIFLLNEHLERLKNAADFFLFKFNLKKISNLISKIISGVEFKKKYKLKLILNKWGKINYELNELNPLPSLIRINVSSKKINTQNKFQYFKTTNRNFYNSFLNYNRDNNFFETIFLNEKNELAEGTITNIFLKKNNIFVTPPIDSGILNGLYRADKIKNENVEERKLFLEDLLNCSEAILTNSVRKEICVDEIYLDKKLIKDFNKSDNFRKKN